ncbi:Protein of unknown function [Terribacillus halophilus]|uniref:DUF3021 domain-containing protein n=1 Tax=Terribacillus halophilus TaxID=361279 RepID=A0A1G6PVW1_9BACI|nr:DUF3021 domain-containing protein [Terribacillus halophilus]SDC84178.1 Protein of unknown function [Terribacillus halophilus]
MKLKDRLYSGIGTGSFVYMTLLLFGNHNIFITRMEIVSVFIISACAGIFTFVFEIEGISYLFSLIIHFLLMILIVYLIALYNHWIDNFPSASFLGSILIIYAFSWAILISKTKRDAKKLNVLLKSKK